MLFEDTLFAGDQVPLTNLFIVHNGQVEDMELEAIFDSQTYSELYAVSYVAGAQFFVDCVAGFKKVEFIIGIPDAAYKSQFKAGLETSLYPLQQLFDVKSRMAFWEDLPQSQKEQYWNQDLDIRYGQSQVLIHDKIYLMRNPDTGGCRVILGSANFTKAAFKKSNQYEQINIIDNDQGLYDLYYQRFVSLKTKTEDYIPYVCRKRPNPQEEAVVTSVTAIEDALIEDITNRETKLVVTDAQLSLLSQEKEEVTFTRQQLDDTEEALRLLVKKNPKEKGSYVVRPKSELLKKKTAIKSIVSRTSKETETIDIRPELQYRAGDVLKLDPTSNPEAPIYEPYSREADVDTIRSSLLLIQSFIEAYDTYAKEVKPKNKGKIYEILLYSFLSPLIWKLRQDSRIHTGRENTKHDITPFMIIAGNANSGKTTAIEFVQRLMGGSNVLFKYVADIKNHDGPKSSVLLDLFMSNNVFPLFVDEVEGTFFHNNKSDMKGAKFIKYITNNFEQVHPCFIGSTNIKDFSTTHEIQRRLYYIELDNTFSNDKEKKQESINHIDSLLGQVDDSLFRDFLYRLQTYTEPGMTLFLDVADMLAVARRIFREYYQMAGLPVPDYFPTGVYNDYYTKGRKLWQSAYFAHPEAFREYDDLISVDVGQLRNYKTEQAMMVNFLDVSCIRTADARNPILFKDKFFAFIGRDMSKRSRLKSWLGIKQRGFKDLD